MLNSFIGEYRLQLLMILTYKIKPGAISKNYQIKMYWTHSSHSACLFLYISLNTPTYFVDLVINQTFFTMSSVYKVIEVIGSSEKSWEDAANVAIERASKSLEDLRIAEVISQDVKIEHGKVAAYRTKVRLSFKFKD